MKKKTFNIALCGLISALGVVIMMITAIIPTTTYAMPAMASLLLTVIVIETDKKWALASYFVVSVLSLLLVPDKESVAFYILFFGYYPIYKQIIESKIKHLWLQWLLKILVFSISAIIIYFIAILILGVPADEFTVFGINVPLLFLIAGIAVFIIFDRAMTRVIVAYVIKLRKKLFGKLTK
ncbi:MAG: hypothetical protein II233_01050 [Clostridia bacterium]|nr:hypothetical protein [Clostridia bacterium]MEE1126099.1 hypothetical protein [Acutalibacteraceae bacterium]